MSNDTNKNAGANKSLGDTGREDPAETARRATGQAAGEAARTGGTGAAHGAAAKSQAK